MKKQFSREEKINYYKGVNSYLYKWIRQLEEDIKGLPETHVQMPNMLVEHRLLNHMIDETKARINTLQIERYKDFKRQG